MKKTKNIGCFVEAQEEPFVWVYFRKASQLKGLSLSRQTHSPLIASWCWVAPYLSYIFIFSCETISYYVFIFSGSVKHDELPQAMKCTKCKIKAAGGRAGNEMKSVRFSRFLTSSSLILQSSSQTD